MGSQVERFEVVSTVNTVLSNEYDFGIHAAGCRDVGRAKRAGCTVSVVEAENVAAVIEQEVDDLIDGGFEREEAELFAFRSFPCCEQKGGA